MLDYPEPTGHTVFREGIRSPCQWHGGLCAYTGTEHDRCTGCHMLWAKIVSCRCIDCRASRKAHMERHVKLWGRKDKKRLRMNLERANMV